jgi:hypothetical protein
MRLAILIAVAALVLIGSATTVLTALRTLAAHRAIAIVSVALIALLTPGCLLSLITLLTTETLIALLTLILVFLLLGHGVSFVGLPAGAFAKVGIEAHRDITYSSHRELMS